MGEQLIAIVILIGLATWGLRLLAPVKEWYRLFFRPSCRPRALITVLWPTYLPWIALAVAILSQGVSVRKFDNELLASWIYVVTVVVVFAPIVEEIWFRGLLLRWLSKRLSSRTADWVQACAFALLHALLGFPLITVISSVALGIFNARLIRHGYGLATPVVAHALANLSIVLTSGLALGESQVAAPLKFEREHYIGMLSIGLVQVFAMLYSARRLRVSPRGASTQSITNPTR
jgi:membrane protease YdiL (CAAX protease family)